MALRYALYPGCAAKGATPELFQSTMAVIGRLGIEVTELTASSCCGAGVVAEADPEGALALSARTFAQAERLGLDVMTICGTCQGVMSAANRQLKGDAGLLERVNRLLQPEGLTYQGGIQVKHLLWIVVREVGLEKLKGEVQVTLGDLRLAPFYGCYILRPSWDLGFDDPENPNSLEKVIRAVGAEPVDYRGKIKCCGFPIILEKEDIALTMNGANLKEAKDEGADAMVTPCPLCHMSLDIYQERAAKKINARLDLPVLHLPQMLGLAMGVPADELGMGRHLVSVDPILKMVQERRTKGERGEDRP
ncbi:MAG TPA: CoB--CoM heterodisulfide reductase iron-sulfur subunit B family protein [Nitrospirales bacterium]|nr:CoB--CoM heterodisulfide reductase iron-sulfur subunit B family protein [Nitrospirales bacterium]